MADDVEIFLSDVVPPKQRDPKVPPFYVEQTPFQTPGWENGGYRVMGTFRNGITSLQAVPHMNFRGSKRYGPWSQWLSKTDAMRWAQHLNKLHADGHIDWSGPAPAIIPTIDWQPVRQ